jgi:5-methylcytosine-specific restriction endonuclease McrA
LPRYCPNCRYERQLAASKRWKDRNAERVVTYRQEYDADPEHREANKERARRYRERNVEAIAVYRHELYVTRQQVDNAAKVAAYRAANPGKHPEIQNRRRARYLGQFVAPVDHTAIRARDQGRCGICGLAVPVDQESLDHIVPLALGGTHEPANVQLAHRVCNSRKGAKAPVVA